MKRNSANFLNMNMNINLNINLNNDNKLTNQENKFKVSELNNIPKPKKNKYYSSNNIVKNKLDN